MEDIVLAVGVIVSLIGAHSIAKATEHRLARYNKKWLTFLLPLVVLVASFAAIAAAFIVITLYTLPNQGFSR